MKKIILLFVVIIFSNFKISAQILGWGEVGASSDSIFKNGPIIAMVNDAQNNIYATGEFPDSAGNYFVAKWNGQTWSKLGTGANALNANSWILYMANDTAGNIYLSGAFTNSASQSYIAKWNGQTWSSINVTIPGYTFNGNNIAVDKMGNLYVSVNLNNAPPTYEVAKWNGQSWSLLGSNSALLNANNTINAIASDTSGNIYVGGPFTDSLSSQVGSLYVAKWNGQNWSSLTSSSSNLNSLSTTYGITNILPDNNGNIYIHCDLSIYKWNGQNWSTLDSAYVADGAYYKTMCINTLNNIYSMNGSTSNCAKWNGNQWNDLGGNNPAIGLHAYSGMISMFCDNQNDIYAVGYVLNSKGGFYVAKFGLQNCISYFSVDYDTLINTFLILTDTATTTKLATAYHWDFGDGTSSNLQFPTHTYLVDTLYNVCLTIKGINGDSCTYCHRIGKDYLGNITKSGGFNLNVVGQKNIGITESLNSKNEIIIYPNPANNQLTVSSSQLTVSTIEVTNVLGQACIIPPLQRELGLQTPYLSEGFEINIETLPNGIYFLKATDTNGNTMNAKFVKE
jgi:hypothetical protein